MIEEDTIRLLRECDAGVKMGVASIDDVLSSVSDDDFRKKLMDCKSRHDKLGDEIEQLLNEYHDEVKEPGIMAKGMSQMKIDFKLAIDKSDNTIAEIMTDGCNMGVKSLSRYLNQYKAADEKSKDIAKRLIKLEEKLAVDIRRFL